MRQPLLSILFVVFALPALASQGYNVEPTPDWVTPIEVSETSQSADLAGHTIHYQLVDAQTRWSKQNDYFRFKHYVEKPLTIDGLQDSGAIEIFFKPDFQQVSLHTVSIQRNGNRMNALENARISVLDVEPESENNLYSGMSKVLIIVSDYRLGDTLEYSYTLTGQNPVFGDNIISSFSLGWSVPVDRVYRQLIVPEQRALSYKVELLDIEPEHSVADGYQHFAMQLENVPAYVEDSESPGFFNVYPYISFSSSASWREVTNWAKPLFQYLAPKQSAQWQQWVKEVNALTGEEEKVTHALQLVQDNIRYVGIEIGENSHKPHAPDETLKLGYGDCKDKTLLLVSILEAAGIEAEPFLVNTIDTESLNAWLPNPSAFNHVITRVNVNGQYHYVDPTLSYQAGEKINQRGYYNYAYGLPVYSDVGLIKMPERDTTDALLTVKQVFQGYDFELPVLLTTTAKFTHDEADYQRYRFANTTADEITRNYVDYYSRYYGSSKVHAPLSYSDDKENNIFTVTLQLWVSDFYQYDEQRDRYDYSIEAYAVSDYITVPDRIDRNAPYWIADLSHVLHEIHVRHPQLYNPTGIEPITRYFSSDTFDFSTEVFDLANESLYLYRYKNLARYVDADDLTEYAKEIKDARDYLGFSGWFQAGESSPDDQLAAQAFFQSLISSYSGKETLQ